MRRTLTVTKSKYKSCTLKADGVCKAFNQWYIAENTKSNKRHLKSNGENFMPKTPFHSEVKTWVLD